MQVISWIMAGVMVFACVIAKRIRSAAFVAWASSNLIFALNCYRSRLYPQACLHGFVCAVALVGLAGWIAECVLEWRLRRLRSRRSR